MTRNVARFDTAHTRTLSALALLRGSDARALLSRLLAPLQLSSTIPPTCNTPAPDIASQAGLPRIYTHNVAALNALRHARRMHSRAGALAVSDIFGPPKMSAASSIARMPGRPGSRPHMACNARYLMPQMVWETSAAEDMPTDATDDRRGVHGDQPAHQPNACDWSADQLRHTRRIDQIRHRSGP